MPSSYLDFLKKDVFKTEEYDQFNLMFEALEAICQKPSTGIAILERSYIYGGRSLFAPLIPKTQPVFVIDYRPVSAEARTNYQGSWLDSSGFEFPIAKDAVIDMGNEYRFSFNDMSVDTLLVPNVLHHCRDFSGLVARFLQTMPALRRIFVYDSYLREGHQIPDDFCRYTPSALAVLMRDVGFSTASTQETGNVFDGILYLMSQAQWQLHNAAELAPLRRAFDELRPKLVEVRRDARYRPLGRPHAHMSTAYAMTFER